MFKREIEVKKATAFTVTINSMQILMSAVLLGMVLFGDRSLWTRMEARLLAAVAMLIVGVGAAFDIRDVLQSRRLMEQVDGLENTVEGIESLNATLRGQRHDFLNHLQVVYSLMEMGEYAEANAYIERVYGAITRVSRVLKTASPAINALLQNKCAAAESQGVKLELSFSSDWHSLAMPAWEMCKVLSNLLDNAIEAMSASPEKRLTLHFTEDLHTCRATISNTGPTIDPDMLEHIFAPGVTTKGPGHGMGLWIVRKTLESAGGGVRAESRDGLTTFEIWAGKRADVVSGQ